MKDNRCTMRDIPAIESILHQLTNQPDLQHFSHKMIVDKIRVVVSKIREKLRNQQILDISVEVLAETVKEQLITLCSRSLCKVVNATGVVLHTNLGRAPLSNTAIKVVNEVMAGYSTLEYNVKTGERGSRYSHVVEKLCALTGAEDAIIVNNNAAAVLLVVSALAKDREVLVSRGQLVEIGGSFRIPDVLKQGGARLVEVGSTNKTHLKDFEQGITSNTGLLLKVHTSNYRIIGFAAQPEDKELVKLAKQSQIPIVEDLGSGTFNEVKVNGWHEPTVSECLASGIDIVTFSGDKLLGAGQAGIIAGKKQYIALMKTHPLLRAFRIDKLSLAALEGTLIDYLIGNVNQEIPVQYMLHREADDLQKQAYALAERLQPLTSYGWSIEVLPLISHAGGGTLPEVEFKSFGVSVVSKDRDAAALERAFRYYTIPIITRIHSEKILFDVRCLRAEDMVIIEEACYAIEKEGLL